MSKNSEKLYGAISGIGDKYLADAENYKPQRKKNRKIVYSAVAAMLVCAVTVTAVFVGGGRGGSVSDVPPEPVHHFSPFAAAAADYPETEKFPVPDTMTYDGYLNTLQKWGETTAEKEKNLGTLSDGTTEFFRKTVSEFMTGRDGNVVFSPTNVYLALSMLSECAAGETKDQLLALLGEADTDSVRSSANAVWKAAYTDDGVTRSLLANSLWLRHDMNYNESLVKTLAENYFASTFVGEMGSPEYDKMLQDWLNDQTGGLLEEHAGKEKFDSETALALVSAIHFKAGWDGKFWSGATKKSVFHGKTDERCDFMNGGGDTAYIGDGFIAEDKYFRNNEYKMTFILPDEGKTPDDLLRDESALDFIVRGGESLAVKADEITLSLPKFDVDSSLDLKPMLEELGVKDAFVRGVADFTPVSPGADSPYVSGVSHAARVTVDEDGCEAAAFTIIYEATSCVPLEYFRMTLDRPFIFVIRGAGDLPLFVGIVCDVG